MGALPERHAEGMRDGRTRVDSTTAESARCPRVSGCAHSREPTNIFSGRRGRGSAREICDTRVCSTCAFTYHSPRPRGHNNDRGMTDSAAAPRAPTPLEFAKLQSRLAIAESARRASDVRLEELERAHEREREKGAARVAELSARLDLERRRADAMEAREVEQEARARVLVQRDAELRDELRATHAELDRARDEGAAKAAALASVALAEEARKTALADNPDARSSHDDIPRDITVQLISAAEEELRRAEKRVEHAERETQATRRRSEGVRDQFIAVTEELNARLEDVRGAQARETARRAKLDECEARMKALEAELSARDDAVAE